ncbi:MAG: Rpn family recombination-promoting nuclease/putative transposase [Clostridiales bacterium]|nr:Rpn family recombination-promoting nuclease/putative transposase [Clostridiales bacterium]
MKNFMLFDDDFFGAVFEHNYECTELLLNIVLNRNDIKVKTIIRQREIKSLEGHSIRLDISAEDSENNLYNCEIQREDQGNLRLRSRYYSSLLDSTLLKKGESYDKLVPTYVIFFTEKDTVGDGKALHHYMMKDADDNSPLGDNRHIYFINGEYNNEEQPIGKLMHDFKCKSADEMYFDVLAKRVRHFKESEGGIRNMCKALEDMRRETAVLERIDTYQEMGCKESEILERIMKKFNLTKTEANAYFALSKEDAYA